MSYNNRIIYVIVLLLGFVFSIDAAYAQGINPIYISLCRILGELMTPRILMSVAAFALIYRSFTVFILVNNGRFNGNEAAITGLQIALAIGIVISAEHISNLMTGGDTTCKQTLTSIDNSIDKGKFPGINEIGGNPGGSAPPSKGSTPPISELPMF